MKAAPKIGGARLRLLVALLSVVLSLLVTAAMSLLFNGRVRGDMMATGLVCATVVTLIVDRMVRNQRRALYRMNDRLEARVQERTRELKEAHRRIDQENEERQRLREKLVVQDRMATAGLLAAGIGHEIRNPLTAVVANLELARLLVDSPDRAELDDLLGEAQQAAARVERVCRDLSTVARPADDSTRPVTLAPVVDSALRLAAHELGRCCEVRVEVEEGLSVQASPDRLCQVLLNLLVNAAKSTRPGTMNQVLVRAQQEEELARIEVWDEGCGIPQSIREQVFQPFFTTRAHEDGNGLGLHVSRSIVESLGGRIAAEDRSGPGTVLRLWLPVAFAEARAAAS